MALTPVLGQPSKNIQAWTAPPSNRCCSLGNLPEPGTQGWLVFAQTWKKKKKKNDGAKKQDYRSTPGRINLRIWSQLQHPLHALTYLLAPFQVRHLSFSFSPLSRSFATLWNHMQTVESLPQQTLKYYKESTWQWIAHICQRLQRAHQNCHRIFFTGEIQIASQNLGFCAWKLCSGIDLSKTPTNLAPKRLGEFGLFSCSSLGC